MTIPKQTVTLHNIRQNIGRNLGLMIASTATANASTTTLTDTVGLLKGVTDEYKRQMVYITSTVAGAATIYSGAFTSSFNATTQTLTFAPAMDFLTKATQSYELWKDYLVSDIHDFINQAVTAATPYCLIEKADITLTTAAATYAYAIPSGFVGIYMVEYLPSATANYVQLSPDYWGIDRPNFKLVISDTTLSITGASKTLRLSGYRIPALLTVASTATDVDPEYLIAEATSRALLAGAPSNELDTQQRIAKATYWRQIAQARIKEIKTPVASGTRWC
jgi:hypothetical protein